MAADLRAELADGNRIEQRALHAAVTDLLGSGQPPDHRQPDLVADLQPEAVRLAWIEALATAVWLVLSYLWLPYMVLPIFAGLDRLPDSLLEASSDLGAHALRTFRSVVLPLALPAVVAGSIFTFSLTLGDYIAPSLVGGPGSSLIGTVVFENLGLANNAPFAAAFATVPLAIMAVYLVIMKRLGAFESL